MSDETAQPLTPLARCWELAMNDEPFEALRAAQADGVTDPALLEQLTQHLDHMRDRESYRTFYEEDAPERTFLPEPYLPHAHRIHTRIGLLRQTLDRQGAETILELGCYDAWVLLNLAFAGYRGAGIDLAPHAIVEARARAERHRLPFVFHQGFLEDLHLPERFDAVLVLEVLEHVLDVDAALAAAERHVTPTGWIYVSAPLTAPQHEQWRARKEHVRRFTPEKLGAVLNAPGRREEWYVQFHGPGWLHHMGAYSLNRPVASVSDGPMLTAIATVGQNVDLVRSLLATVLADESGPEHDIVVFCDEASRHIRRLLHASERIQVITTAVRHGAIGGVNRALERFLATPKYGSLCLLSDSIRYEPGTRADLHRVLAGHPQFGWVACQDGDAFLPWCSLLSREAAQTLEQWDLLFAPSTHYGGLDAYRRLCLKGVVPHRIPRAIAQPFRSASVRPGYTHQDGWIQAAHRELFRLKWGEDNVELTWGQVPVHGPCPDCGGA
jgi:2-polyprenyl-3-methyl-5-hydroxy-6-metoxy-1,4-benzoquinol methylase